MNLHVSLYYCREKYYHTMRLATESASKHAPEDSILRFQFCVALILDDCLGEALRELELLLPKPNVGFASLIASIYAQNLCEVPDGEAIIILENRLKTEKKRADEAALYHAAIFCLQTNDFKKAHEYVDSIFRLNRTSARGLHVKGWIELHEGRPTVAADCFRSVLSQDGENFDAALGEIRSLSQDDAISKLNMLIVKYPKFTPPLIEKMRLMLAEKDWEQAFDIANRALSIDPACIPASQFKVLYEIRIRGDYEYLMKHVDELVSLANYHEPKNWLINYELGLILSRLCGFNADAVRRFMKLVESSLQISPNNVEISMELARQHYLAKNYQNAVDLYKKVARLDDSHTEALIGLIKCRIAEGELNDEIKQQIEFLSEVYKGDLNADMLLLIASTEETKVAEKCMMQAINFRFKNAEKLPFGLPYLIELDATFILEVLKKLPSSANTKPLKVEKLLKLSNILPGLIEVWLYLVEVYLEMDNFKDGENVLRHVLNNLDEMNSEANLLLARVLIQQKKYDEAKSTLDLCLSQNLNIRSRALFHFLEGKIYKYKNDFKECINSSERAISCLSGNNQLKDLDIASLYLDLSSSYQIMRQHDAAADAIHKATSLLEGTPQEDQIVMARADLELWKNDANKALELLSSITSDSSVYLEARTKMADIYLKYTKDSLRYIECYKQLVKDNPTQENLIKLAEAYFSIRQISEAVEIYERAIRDKSSSELYKKLAEMYCKCHQYQKAINCYREAGTKGSLDLAHLLFRMHKWKSSEDALSQVPFQDKILLLARIKEKQGDLPTALNLLNEAYKKYCRTNDKLSTQLCCQMAEYEVNLHDFEAAIRHYKHALSHCEDNISETIRVQISLAKLYLQVNDWQPCNTICSSLLSKDPNNELALLVAADLSLRKCEFSTASNLFHKILSLKPTDWFALVRMVEVKRRMGALKESKAYLNNAAAADSRNNSGLNYCFGMYHWYNNDLQEAIKFFELVKYDQEWGQQALCNMVEIHLASGDGNYEEKAEELLQDIRPTSREEETNRNLLKNFIWLASKDKQLIEKAMNELTSLASRDISRIGASLGLATGYILQKQGQRARNVLKIIAKTAWHYEEAEYLERCWLMLVEHYIQSSKQELAFELIRKILNYNAGCAKAHELLGLIAEKDQKYGDPTSHYLKAWTLVNERDVSLAYRLGMFFLKSKKYADAICTCQTILKNVPESGARIKKDIYEKSLSLLRT